MGTALLIACLYVWLLSNVTSSYDAVPFFITVCVYYILTASDNILQTLPSINVEQRIAPTKLKSVSCFATRLSHRVSKLHKRTTATQRVALIVFIFAIHNPLTYYVVVLRKLKNICYILYKNNRLKMTYLITVCTSRLFYQLYNNV